MRKLIVALSSALLMFPGVSFAAINSLNGLTGVTQVFATSSASDTMHLLIQSSGTTHTFKWDGTPWKLSQGGTNSTTAFATGSIPFISGNKFTENNAQLFWDTLTSSLNIGGTVSPAAKLTVKGVGGGALLNIVASSTSAFFINSTGNVGIGSTSPFAKLSVHAVSNDTNQVLFAIASSTLTGSSTLTTALFKVSNTGSTTIANGVNLTAGCYAINGVCLSFAGGGGSGVVGSSTQGQIAYYPFNGSTVFGTSTIFVAPTQFVGINTTNPQSPLDVNGAMYSRLVYDSDAPNVTIDWNKGNVHQVFVTGDTTFLFINGQAGGEYRLILIQSGFGTSSVIRWPASVKWPGGTEPVLSSTASSTDMLTFVNNGFYLGSADLNY
jgi:hypothetical protein